MDGLDLSLRFRDKIVKEGNKENILDLLNIGTYSLHDIDGECRMGYETSGCNIKKNIKSSI